MEVPKKFYSNAISEDCPSYFKSTYIEVRKQIPQKLGKHIFPIPGSKDLLSPRPEKKNQSQMRMPSLMDQDLDSLKLSVQPDITRGHKNTLRYQSNHHKFFFEKVESSGFNRLTTEITSLNKMPKIVRTLKAENSSRTKSNSYEIKKNEIRQYEDRSNELSYLMELKEMNYKKKTLPKIEINYSPAHEIEEFEKKLQEGSFEKCKNVYGLYHIKKKVL